MGRLSADDNMMVLELITPERVTYKLEVKTLVVPTLDGFIAIWYNHAPLITALGTGIMWYRDNAGVKGGTNRFAINTGFMEVLDNSISVFAETIERGDEVDLERALAAKQRAEERLRIRSSDIDVERAQLSLARAIARIRAARGS